MFFSALTLATRRREAQFPLLLFLVVLPVYSYPLSWLPKSWASFRFNCTWPVAETVLALVLLVIGWFLLWEGVRAVQENCLSIPLPRFVILPLVAVVLSGLVSTRFSPHSYLGLSVLPRLGGNAMIFLLAAYAPRDRLGELCRWWVIVAVIVAGNGLLRLASESEFVSTLGNRNFLGAYLAASVAIAISVGRSWSLLGTLMLMSGIWFCGSRGAWLALGTVAILWFLRFGDRHLKRWYVRAVIVLIILTGASCLGRTYVLRQWQTDVRPMIWKATLHMVARRPLLGHGLGTYAVEYPQHRLPEYFLRPKASNVTDHAHNELLEVAAEQGLIGLAAILWLWATALWCGVRGLRRAEGEERRVMFGLMGAMLVLMLHGLVDVDLRYLPNQSLLWLLMGLLVGADTTPSKCPSVTFHSRLARLWIAAVCLVLGVWIAVRAVVYPVVADLRDRHARIAEERGDLQTAIQSALESLQIQPFRLSTRYLLAGMLSRLPDPRAHQFAIEQCRRIEELAPDYADVTYNLGQLYLAAGQVSEALPYLRRVAQINPYNMEHIVALASALHDVGQNDEALSQLERALQIQPENQQARELLRRIQKKQKP